MRMLRTRPSRLPRLRRRLRLRSADHARCRRMTTVVAAAAAAAARGRVSWAEGMIRGLRSVVTVEAGFLEGSEWARFESQRPATPLRRPQSPEEGIAAGQRVVSPA